MRIEVRPLKRFLRKNLKLSLRGYYSEKQINEKQLSWADLIVVMDEEQRKEIGKRFPKMYLQKKFYL